MNLKTISILLAITTMAATYAYISAVKKQKEQEISINTLKTSNIRLTAKNNDLIEATKLIGIRGNIIERSGMNGYKNVTKETQETLDKVVHFLEKNPKKEPEYFKCVSRFIETTQWGSMGVYGEVDECIKQVVNDEAAKLIFSVDKESFHVCTQAMNDQFPNGTNMERMSSTVNDANCRLLNSAKYALQEALSTKNKIMKQK